MGNHSHLDDFGPTMFGIIFMLWWSGFAVLLVTCCLWYTDFF